MTIQSLLADPHFGELKSFVLKHTGLSYYSDKDEDFATRLSRRFAACSSADCSTYFRLLTGSSARREEMDRLIGELTIGETYFFRQRAHFDLLRDQILPDMIARNRDLRSLRIWSAGCATGAEPYSISILLQHEFQAQLVGWNVSILATDINIDFLTRAKEAKFGEWALRESPEELRSRCFVREGKEWKLRPEFRRGVVFGYHNLASEKAPELADQNFDLILCRNVLIYFSREQAVRILSLFRDVLFPGGWLLVGYAEPNQEMFNQFETVSTPEATVYRKAGVPPSVHSRAMDIEPAYWEPPPSKISPARIEEQSESHTPPPMIAAGDKPSVEDVRILADTGRWAAATQLAKKLLESDSLNPVAYFTSALIDEHLGNKNSATMALRRAIYLDRGFALAHYHLGLVLTADGERGSAGRSFRNTLEILAGVPGDEPIPHGDSITAGELHDLAVMHLEMSGNE